jgi:hypothetical protein
MDDLDREMQIFRTEEEQAQLPVAHLEIRALLAECPDVLLFTRAL